jgi:FkbM family methyltransferase
MDKFQQLVFHENGKTYRMAFPDLIQVFPISFNMRRSVHEYLKFVASPRPIKYIVDVGACIGAFAIPYSIMWPDAEILCIEPSKQNYPFLAFNVKYLPRVKAIKLAAHHERMLLRIASPTIVQRSPADSDADTGLISIYGEGVKHEETVHGERLDDIVTRPVDWLKIDVEGNEINVLKGAERILTEDKPMLQVEIRQENQAMAGASVAKLILNILGHNYLPAGSIRGDMIFRPGAHVDG